MTHENLRAEIRRIILIANEMDNLNNDNLSLFEDKIISLIDPIIKERNDLHELAGLSLEHAFNSSFKGDQSKGEQLEVEIISLSKYFDESRDSFCIHFKDDDFECGKFFKTKQEALAFCAKFNLKVVGDE